MFFLCLIREVPVEKSAEPVVEEPTAKAPGKRGAPAKEVKEKDTKAAKPAAATAQAPKAAKKEVSEGERRVLPPRAAKTVQKWARDSDPGPFFLFRVRKVFELLAWRSEYCFQTVESFWWPFRGFEYVYFRPFLF